MAEAGLRVRALICKRLLGGVLLLVTMQGSANLMAQVQSKSGCGRNSTVADFDPSAVKPAEAFLAQLQAAVRDNARRAVTTLVDYPLRVNGGRRPTYFRLRQTLFLHYNAVFTAKVRQAIVAQQPACMFANAQGIMIGDGEVWFDKTAKGKYAILSINPR